MRSYTWRRGAAILLPMSSRVRVGLIGCGAISGVYLQNCGRFPIIDVVACADLKLAAAHGRAREFNIPRVLSVRELLADPDIDVVLNLTIPAAHGPMVLETLLAAKHAYVEKPLAITRTQGEEIVRAAREKKLLVGGAPDTFLGSGLQTARRAIDDGLIGRPIGFTAFMMSRGVEHWHPNPIFYYEPGGGPMLDMGPYYVSALLNLLGPVRRISGMSSIAIPERTIGSAPRRGQTITVTTPDHYCGIMEFANGAIGSIIQSFATDYPPFGSSPIVIFGTDAQMQVPDPNRFDGEVKIRRIGVNEWTVVPPVFPHDYGRGIGLADLCESVLAQHNGNTRPVRASVEQAMATLDLMLGFDESSQSGQTYQPRLTYHRPAPLPLNADFGVF